MNAAIVDDRAQVERSARQQWVDVARGVGIILVVWGHVARANLDFATTPWAATQDRWIYAFHMPLFFLLAGLFLWPAIGRGRAAFVRGRWWAIIWPYVLWSIVVGGIEVAMSAYVNTPIAASDIAMIPVQPIEQYWFLYALLVCQLVAVAAWPSVTYLWLAAAAGLALLAVAGGGWIGIRAFAFLPFVAAGVAFAGRLSALAGAPVPQQLAFAVLCWALFAIVMLWLPASLDNPNARLLPAAAGSFATVATAMLIARGRHPIASALIALGQASLAIYVLHTLFSAGARIALNLAGIAPSTPLSLAFSVASGLILPLLVYRLALARGLARPLGLGATAPPPRVRHAPAPA